MGFFSLFSIFHNPLPTEDGGVDNTIDCFPDIPTFTDDDGCCPSFVDDGTSNIGTDLFGSDTMFDDSSSDPFGSDF